MKSRPASITAAPASVMLHRSCCRNSAYVPNPRARAKTIDPQNP
jgi:hypothetical protein